MISSELEERLICFAVLVIDITNDLPNTIVGNNIASQLSRSGTSPALNYGEARGGESMRDFIHKIQIVVKELRETFISLKIIKQANLVKKEEDIQKALKESDELISIFVKSVKTAQGNLKNSKTNNP